MTTIPAIYASVKAALETAKGITSLSKDVAVNKMAMELYGVIGDLRDQLHKMESELMESERITAQWKEKALHREAWDNTKATYSPYRPTPGVLVYITKEQTSPIENAEWYCKNCADTEMIQSTIQMIGENGSKKMFECHRCKFKFDIPKPIINDDQDSAQERRYLGQTRTHNQPPRQGLH